MIADLPLDRIRAFVLAASSAERPKALRCFFFALGHRGERGSEPLCVETLAESGAALDKLPHEAKDERALRIAKRFLESAQALADDQALPARFSVSASTTIAPDVAPIEQIAFRLECSPSARAGLSDGIESPTDRGALATLQRVSSDHVRILHEGVRDARADAQRTADRMERILELTLERNKLLEERIFGLTVALQEALDRSSERQINAYGKKLGLDREERFWRSIEAAVPKVLDKWGAGPLGAFLKSFRPDEIKAFVLACPEDKRPLLYEALDTHLGLGLLERANANGAAAPLLESGAKETPS